MKTQKTLKKLIESDKEHKVISALSGVLQNESLDMKISAIGAMHTSGWLKNRINPFWIEYNHGSEEWIEKSILRALENDFDDYAVSALLKCNINSVIPIIKKIGLKFISSRYYDDYKKGKVYVITFAEPDKFSRKVLSKVIEFGWIKGENEIVDVAAMRAMIFDAEYEIKKYQAYGKSYATYFRRATLPFGNWNLPTSDSFEFKEELNVFDKFDSNIKNELLLLE